MYDYIIVGAGSAGCVLANRLSANEKNKVCLIEAGPILSKSFYRIPFASGFIIMNKATNWDFWTIPQAHLNNRPISWITGKLLGGTSSVNGMLYVRGHASDYDNWANLGNVGWSYKDVLPYFKKSEDSAQGANEYHGVGGPLHVAKLKNISKLTQAYLDACAQAGFPTNNDWNGKEHEGIGLFDVMIKNGQRVSNANAFLDDIKSRKNLTILPNTQIVKILFEGKRATGVRYIKDGKNVDILARKEVIVSSGTANSPKLLLLSGIGPREELEKHGIPIVHELPGVGKNLQDHLDAPVCVFEKTKYSLSFRPDAIFRNFMGLVRYLIFKKGDFMNVVGEGGAFLKSDPNLPISDLQWHFVRMMYGNSQNVEAIKKYNGYTMLVTFLHPYSRGEITLKSADPFEPPNINPNYLADERDIEPLVKGIELARKVFAQPAFDPYRLKEYLPGEEAKTREQVVAYIKSFAEPDYHAVGSCKMGVDNMAVVDPRLKVHGISGLRVIDASIMPFIITGNPHAPTTMIAEKGADMILEDAATKGSNVVLEDATT